MKIRRAATLVCTFEDKKPVVHNFLKKEMFECDARALEILALLDEWTSMDDVLAGLSHPLQAAVFLRELIQRDLVLIEGSPEAARDQRYRDNWRWGSVTGFYHFSLRDSVFVDGETSRQKLIEYGGHVTSPPLMTLNDGMEKVVELPEFEADDPFFEVLLQRRSRREFTGHAIPVKALANCLYAGNGLKEIFDAGDLGKLPMTMTPSGGARNPFELYVDVRAVDGVEPGLYHYSAAEHSLGYLHNNDRPAPSVLLGNQAWTNSCAAIVLLAASFERSAWKYRQALAYRVVLMEVGAITQNIQLAATRDGIAAGPTGALAESEIEILLGLQEIEQAALFAVVLGDPA